jgi:diguanylate cyclase (GGDEF)-like protein
VNERKPGDANAEAGPTRVLVADDSPVARALLSGYLRMAGYEVEEAKDGADALARLAATPFDVVVTDLQMPGVDGFGVLETVKNRSVGAEVIILTGSRAQDVNCAIRALRLGAHDFLTKPPSVDDIVLAVERAVEKKRLRETNQRLLRELEALSRTDALTGTYNRRMFDEALEREVLRSRRYSYALSLVLLDLDHFKDVNDTYGHLAGDEVLKRFAHLVQDVLRDSDAIHRLGGDEFALILPHTPVEGALEAARRVVARTATTPFDAGRVPLKLTATAGVACLQESAETTAEDLLAAADRALYEAKRAGRNRVGAAEPL